ncbi:MAG: 16S rRNA pseudouridine(516) synthase [Dechloromonas sp.]|uniref:Pseudouridine synthase n=1 Tax=Candidatus Dechloromonas phosphorivorans TaxID=2899244 RepID=A0A9D7LPC4_9RHOO|nr:16S rRNA pseudouridine(516) synthase [Candidatus Dechloromonas phosphorivorans]
MQLERILQKHGFGTRKECRTLCWDGRVAVNGQPCDQPFADIDSAGLVLTVDGVDWPYAEFATLMLNKPAGYECSRRPLHHPGVLALLPLPLRQRGVQPVGRLDEDTTGLLLITDNGQLNHLLSSARRKVPKVYLATTKHAVDREQMERLLGGFSSTTSPSRSPQPPAEVVGARELRLTLTGGKYHQVKRMVAAAGNRVEALHREAVGGLSLPEDLKPGQWRWLAAVDLEKLGVSG